MKQDRRTEPGPAGAITRRALVQSGAIVGSAAAFGVAGDPRDRKADESADDRVRSPKRYDMKKSINLWAFPYPERMSLRECFALAKRAGFDAVEVNYDLEDDISPQTSADALRDIAKMARDEGIAISGLCSFLFWPYCPTSNDPAIREKGTALARKMVRAARRLGTEHHEFRVEPRCVEVLEKLVWHYDEPFADSSAIPTYAGLPKRSTMARLSSQGGAKDSSLGFMFERIV